MGASTDRVIDYDRGVIINNHANTGMDVFMYVDDPGKFLTAHGNVVPDDLAKEAGYNVDKLAKDRLRIDRRKQANAAIEKELADENEVEDVLVEERAGFKLVAYGLGRHKLIDPDGNVLNAHPLTSETGARLLTAMAGEKSTGEKPKVK